MIIQGDSKVFDNRIAHSAMSRGVFSRLELSFQRPR